MLVVTRSRGQTSLYIPGMDPQPVSVNEVGVGSDGRTTWQILPGKATGTFTAVDFVGTATLIEGPNDAVLSYTLPSQDFGIVEFCNISSDIAYCTIAVEGTTYFQTQTASPFVVQWSGTSAVSSPSPATISPQGSQPVSSGPSQTPGLLPTKTANERSRKLSRVAPMVWAIVIFAKWLCANA